MKTWKSHQLILFFGFAILSFLITTSSKAHIENKNEEHRVHIKNGLATNISSESTMEITCRSKSTSPMARELSAGEAYEWRVRKRKVYKCYCTWGRYFQIWHAFQPRRDEYYTVVSWVVKEDGFYLSWDYLLNSTRKAVWESE
ncbi:hypothetical protein M5689_006174 [Euphorbia peplus]|nr:hypothetical protein M5689_006174 [Euphorbia peplus]